MKRWPVDLPTTFLYRLADAARSRADSLGRCVVRGREFFAARALDLAFLGLIYNALVSSIFCNWAWIKIATHAPISVSSLSTLMIPIVVVFSGMLLLGERPQWRRIWPRSSWSSLHWQPCFCRGRQAA